MSEEDLIRLCQKGDADAFEKLISVYEKRILNYCYKMMGNMPDAEDAAQEVFVKVFRFIQSFNNQSAFSTWLYRIASNVCLDLLRKAKRQNKGMVHINQQNDEGEDFTLSIEDTAPTPYEEAQLSEAHRELMKALDKLDAEQRKVILLRDVEGFSYDEIAQITGSATGTVKSRINRARRALQKILAPHKELFLR